MRVRVAAVLLLWALAAAPAARAQELTAEDVRGIVQRAAGEAARRGARATVAVVDGEGNPLAVFRMTGAPEAAVVAGQPARRGGACGREGLEGLELPAQMAALSKAATAALMSSRLRAFSTRTAGFLIQHHFPPGVDFTPGGPMFGVQWSSLPCSDLRGPSAPFGFSADPGGLPLFRSGAVVGGVGVEGDGVYGADADPFAADASWEESAALAATGGFDAPADVRADLIVVDGIRLPYLEAPPDVAPAAGVGGTDLVAPRGAHPSRLVPLTVAGASGSTLPGLQPRAGATLGAGDVVRVIEQALTQAARTRSAMNRPLNSPARVTVAVVDASGFVLALFRAPDAPLFSIDAAVQRARTAASFSGPAAAGDLRRAGMAAFLQEAPLDATIAYTSRAVGFLAQPFLPPGVPGGDAGPFGVPAPPVWSPFDMGLQTELLCEALDATLAGGAVPECTRVVGLANGVALAPGGVPLFKNGVLAGAVGVSGDGADQDDLIAAAGAAGLDAPPESRSDRMFIRGVRVPYLKFPRHPEL
jgi:uncharacterized protein GlcG (DUF336 family)